MESTRNQALRPSLWILPLGAALIGAHWLVGLLFFPGGMSPRTDPGGYAHHATELVRVVVQEYVLLLGGLITLLFGVLALADYLARGGDQRWAFAARVLGVSAIALFLPILALPLFIHPTLGDLYLDGHHDVLTVVAALSPPFQGRVATQAYLMVLVSVAGAAAMTVAIWRAPKLSRWAAILYAPGFVLTLTDTPVIAWVGLALLLLAATRIALDARVATAGITGR